LPNFPRYRVDEEDKCDPTITSIFGESVFYRKDLKVFPNPIHSQTNIEIPSGNKGDLYIFDMQGQLILQKEINQPTIQLNLDLGFLIPGTYNIEFLPEKNSERLIWTTQIVKVN